MFYIVGFFVTSIMLGESVSSYMTSHKSGTVGDIVTLSLIAVFIFFAGLISIYRAND